MLHELLSIVSYIQEHDYHQRFIPFNSHVRAHIYKMKETERDRERAEPENYYLFIEDEGTYEKETEIQLHNTPP